MIKTFVPLLATISRFSLSPPTNPPAVWRRGSIHLPSSSLLDFKILKGDENLELKTVLLFLLSVELILKKLSLQLPSQNEQLLFTILCFLKSNKYIVTWK